MAMVKTFNIHVVSVVSLSFVLFHCHLFINLTNFFFNSHSHNMLFFPPYYQPWINYGGVPHVNFQQFIQQDFENANRTEFLANDPNT